MPHLNNIILIGPLATGKSSIAEQLSSMTGLKNYPVDKLKWYYRFNNGYDIVKSRSILKSEGFEALLVYAQHYFTPHDLDHLLKQYNGIIDFGATDSHRRDFKQMKLMQDFLAPYPNVFLILPYEDEKLSEQVLQNRLRIRYLNDPLKSAVINSYLKMNAEFLKSAQNKALSKHIIYANDRPFKDIAEEIITTSHWVKQQQSRALKKFVS
ncbi:MAG: hypothetical protein WDZ35_00225 [Crocinitomicaceae bacterium]